MAAVEFTSGRTALTRTYEFSPGTVPDTTDHEGRYPPTIRVRTVEFRTNTDNFFSVVDIVTLRGNLIRKSDGEPGPSRQIVYSADLNGRRDELPQWLAEFVTAQGLRYGR